MWCHKNHTHSYIRGRWHKKETEQLSTISPKSAITLLRLTLSNCDQLSLFFHQDTLSRIFIIKSLLRTLSHLACVYRSVEQEKMRPVNDCHGLDQCLEFPSVPSHCRLSNDIHPAINRCQLSSLVTLHMRHSRGKMYIGHGNLCVCLCVCLSLTTFSHYCTDPDVTWGNGRRCL